MPSVPLRNYQHAAIYQTAAECTRYAFYYDTGVGKTRVGAGIVATYPDPGWAIVAPRSVFPAWFRELEAWNLRPWSPVSFFHTRRWAKYVDPAPNGGPMLVTPQTLALDRHWEALSKHMGAIIVDESSCLCNPKAKITKRIWKQSWNARRAYLLSGSPAPQGPLWLWAQAEILGAYRGGWWRWANEYGRQIQIRGKQGGPWVLRPGADERILSLLRPVAEYIKKDDVLALDAITEIDRDFAPGKPTPTWEHIAAEFGKSGHIMLRREIVSGFVYDPEAEEDGGAYWGDSARIDAVTELVSELSGRNTILWVQFRATKTRLREELPALGCAVHADPEAFISGSGWRVLVAHPRSCGYGTDGLQHVASDMVFVEGTYSYDEYYQALSRLHRSGQAHPVCVYRLRATGSAIEEAMWDAVTRKMTLAQYLQERLGGQI